MAIPILQKLGTFGPLRCQEAWALERLLREARVFEAVCELSRRWDIPATSAQEVVQFSASRPGFLTFWDQCTEGLSPFICPVERVLLTFCNQYSARLSLRQPGLAEAGEWAASLPPLRSFLSSPVMGPQGKPGPPTQTC